MSVSSFLQKLAEAYRNPAAVESELTRELAAAAERQAARKGVAPAHREDLASRATAAAFATMERKGRGTCPRRLSERVAWAEEMERVTYGCLTHMVARYYEEAYKEQQRVGVRCASSDFKGDAWVSAARCFSPEGMPLCSEADAVFDAAFPEEAAPTQAQRLLAELRAGVDAMTDVLCGAGVSEAILRDFRRPPLEGRSLSVIVMEETSHADEKDRKRMYDARRRALHRCKTRYAGPLRAVLEPYPNLRPDMFGIPDAPSEEASRAGRRDAFVVFWRAILWLSRRFRVSVPAASAAAH